MKKLLITIIFALAPFSAMALPGGPGDPVQNSFSGCAWYGGTGSGIVHERWGCDDNWENCQGSWTWFPASKWPDGPDECDGAGPFYWGPLGDVGEGSDILVPGFYYVCAKGEIFRDKGVYDQACPVDEV
jgi:hypothetical protein